MEWYFKFKIVKYIKYFLLIYFWKILHKIKKNKNYNKYEILMKIYKNCYFDKYKHYLLLTIIKYIFS